MTKQRGGHRTAVVVVTAAMAGCWNQLPPPAAPARLVPTPAAEIGPPPDGATTVLFDADRPAQVSEVTAPTAAAAPRGEAMHRICLTPCAAHLTRGTHRLAFQLAGTHRWAGDGAVEVGANPLAYRYALGHRNPRIGARAGGWVVLAVGVGFLLNSAVYLALADHGEKLAGMTPDDLRTIGRIEGVVGGAVTLAGVVVLATLRPELQPGTGVQWDLANAAPGAQAGP